MPIEFLRFRFENAFFVERPSRGRFEPVRFVIQQADQINEDGRYVGECGAATGQIYFGIDSAADQMIYRQMPPHSESPGITYVPVLDAVVFKNWSQFFHSEMFD